MNKSYVRWFFSWVLFIIGHVSSKIDFLDRGILTGKIYQYSMLKSSDIQGNTDFGPWNAIKDKNL